MQELDVDDVVHFVSLANKKGTNLMSTVYKCKINTVGILIPGMSGNQMVKRSPVGKWFRFHTGFEYCFFFHNIFQTI